MKTINQYARVLAIFGSVVALSLTGCSTASHEHSQMMTQIDNVTAPQVITRQAPGVVEYAWEEPMIDVIDVPPGLDPEGHYYRPGHQEVVEIRQGRWRYYRRKDGSN